MPFLFSSSGNSFLTVVEFSQPIFVVFQLFFHFKKFFLTYLEKAFSIFFQFIDSLFDNIQSKDCNFYCIIISMTLFYIFNFFLYTIYFSFLKKSSIFKNGSYILITLNVIMFTLNV